MIGYALCAMRDRRGLYGWPKWVQVLICLADGIPLSEVGRFASQQDLSDHVWATGNPADMTETGLRYRAEARERLGLN